MTALAVGFLVLACVCAMVRAYTLGHLFCMMVVFFCVMAVAMSPGRAHAMELSCASAQGRLKQSTRVTRAIAGEVADLTLSGRQSEAIRHARIYGAMKRQVEIKRAAVIRACYGRPRTAKAQQMHNKTP
jgi:hypothetical protein